MDNTAIEATFKLCDGDMRRIVNMLQSLHMSSHGSEQSLITAEKVYQFTGMADPKYIEEILSVLLKGTSVKEAYGGKGRGDGMLKRSRRFWRGSGSRCSCC